MTTSARPPVGRGLAITGAMLLGVGALLLFAWSSQGWLKALVVLALFAAGIAINGNRTDYGDDRVTRALGDDVKVGIGASATFVGAYLIGPLVLSFYDSLPQPAVVILLIFGFPLLALLRFVSRDMAVGSIGAALLLPVLGAVLLAQAGTGVATIALVALLVSVALFAVVLAMPRNWDLAQPVSVFGATAASFAVGAGTSSVGMLTAQQADTAVPALPPAPRVAVLAVGLLVAVGFGLVALARHHLASGLIAGSTVAVPPASLLIGHSYRIHDSTPAVVVMIALPVLAAVIAVIALLVPDTRRLLRLALPPHQRPARPVVGASALRAVLGVALVLVAQVIPLIGYAYVTHGVIMVVLFVAGVTLAWWVPATPGAVLACVVLVELGLDAPWWRLAADVTDTRAGLIVVALVGLVVTAGVAVLLVLRHRGAGVFAAAGYALAGALASALGAFVTTGDLAAVVRLIGPLVLLGVPAAVCALRARGPLLSAGQAVGAVLLAAGGFALARLLLPVTNTSGVLADVALAPLIPTSTGVGGGLPGSAAAPPAALLVFVIAVPLLVSTVRRPSVALAATGVFVLVEAAATALTGAAGNWPRSSVDLMVTAVLLVAVVVSAVAIALLNRRQAASTPTAP